MQAKKKMQLKVFYWGLMALLFATFAWLNTEVFYRVLAITWVVICIVYIVMFTRKYYKEKKHPQK